MRHRVIVLLALVAACSGAAAAAMAGSTSSPLSGTMGVAVLKAPAGVENSEAGGGFAMVFNQKGRTLAYWLRFTGLASQVTSAQIYVGSPSAPGSAVVTLCSPCKASFNQHTLRLLQSRQVALLAKNLRAQSSQGFSRLFVRVKTAANPNGEIEGAIPYLCNPCPFPPPLPCRLSPQGCLAR